MDWVRCEFCKTEFDLFESSGRWVVCGRLSEENGGLTVTRVFDRFMDANAEFRRMSHGVCLYVLGVSSCPCVEQVKARLQ